MKVDDWIWRLSNKRPPKPYEVYLAIVGVWFYLGLICGSLIVASIALKKGAETLWFLPMLIGVVTIAVLSWSIARQHKLEGYYDNLHKLGKQRWHNRAIRLGMIKDDSLDN